MSKTYFMMLAASGIILLSCQQSGGNSTSKDSTLQTASEPPAVATRYVKKFTHTLAGDEPEIMHFRYDAQHRLSSIQKEGQDGNDQEFGYDASGNLVKLMYRHNDRRYVIQYTYNGNNVTGVEKMYENEEDTDAMTEITWKIELSNGKVVRIQKENKEEPSENSLQLVAYAGENIQSITSMSPDGKNKTGAAEFTYGKQSNPFAGARLPLLHPTALLLLQPVNDMAGMTLRNLQYNVAVKTEYAYKYDAQGYPVSSVERADGEVSATSVYEYE
ncbi:hypothetical protein WJU16_00155 [Chitinophaga pollutisoli]|uniref:YD repeat-containing protein n=1 Tax=Chitinophaga pollutisoli TaxID=3133966 RepID=A0ABZ2YRJ1_9BACT